MLKFTAGVIVTLLLVAVIGGGLFLKNKTIDITKPIPETKVTATVTPLAMNDKTATASSDSFEKTDAGFVNPSATIDAIDTSLKTKVYTNLSPYVTETVIVTLGASECCGILSKDKTIQQLSYLNEAALPWDFSATNPIAKQLIEKDATNFKDAVIGTSSNRYAVAFHLNDAYLIEKIFIIADYRLITGE